MSDLLDLRTVNTTWNVGPCAEVRVGEHVTRYVRRGSGSSVILLGADADTNPVWGPLVESLSGNHRLVIPQPPPDHGDASAWLRGFIEGVGLSAVVIIAGGPLADAALDLATFDDFTVRKLVLVSSDESNPDDSNERILRASSGWSPTDALRRIEDFVSR